MRSIYDNRKEKQVSGNDLFSSVVELLPSVVPEKSEEDIKRIATYLMIGLHMASQTNLSSAATWLVINLMEHEKERRVWEMVILVLFLFLVPLSLTLWFSREKVLARNLELKKQNKDYITSLDSLASMEELEKVIYETIRISQQSLTLRLVQTPMKFPLPVRVQSYSYLRNYNHTRATIRMARNSSSRKTTTWLRCWMWWIARNLQCLPQDVQHPSFIQIVSSASFFFFCLFITWSDVPTSLYKGKERSMDVLQATNMSFQCLDIHVTRVQEKGLIFFSFIFFF